MCILESCLKCFILNLENDTRDYRHSQFEEGMICEDMLISKVEKSHAYSFAEFTKIQ